MVINFQIYDNENNLIGTTSLANQYTFDHYKKLYSPDGKLDFDFIPENKEYEWGRFDFHSKQNKIEEDKKASIVKITVQKYEMLKKGDVSKIDSDEKKDWESFPI